MICMYCHKPVEFSLDPGAVNYAYAHKDCIPPLPPELGDPLITEARDMLALMESEGDGWYGRASGLIRRLVDALENQR